MVNPRNSAIKSDINPLPKNKIYWKVVNCETAADSDSIRRVYQVLSMKNINSSAKTETRLGQAFKPIPAFVSGIIAGSIVTVYGTLTNVNLFKYIGSNSQDIIEFYRDLLSLSRASIISNQGLNGYFEKLNIRVDPIDFKVDALPSSICHQVIRVGDRINLKASSESGKETVEFEKFEKKVEGIIEKGTGSLAVESVEDETVLIEIDLLTDQPECRRKTPKIQQLEKLLEEKKWQTADEKTYEILLDLANREAEENLDRSAINNLNCSDLKTINQIEITDYTMIDTIAKGHRAYKKVIAQQVKNVFPQAHNIRILQV